MSKPPAAQPPPVQPPQEVINPFFYGLAGLVLRFRWPLLIATLAITVVAGLQVMANLRIDNNVRAFVSSKSRSNQVLEELRADFGRDDLFLILVGGDVFSIPYLELKTLKVSYNWLGGLFEVGDLVFDVEDDGEKKPARSAFFRSGLVKGLLRPEHLLKQLAVDFEIREPES